MIAKHNKEKNKRRIHFKNSTWKNVLTVTFLTIILVSVGLFFGYKYLLEPASADQVQMANELKQMELEFNLLNKELKEAEAVLEDMSERDNNIYRSFFELSPGNSDVSKAGFGGVDRYSQYAELSYGELVADAHKNLDILNKRIVQQSVSLDEVLKAAKNKEERFKHIPAMQPIANKQLNRLASGYGMRLHPILKVGRMHWGMDFSAPKGTPIYATGNGTVKVAGDHGGYGKVVIIDHKYGYETLYAHMSKVKTRSGAKVKRGDIIGYVGNSGLSTGPHLHYEIKKDGERIDPISFFNQDISPDEFKKLFAKSQEMGVSLD